MLLGVQPNVIRLPPLITLMFMQTLMLLGVQPTYSFWESLLSFVKSY